jgi:trigger factor
VQERAAQQAQHREVHPQHLALLGQHQQHPDHVGAVGQRVLQQLAAGRAVLELRRNGFTDTEIQTYENELRQNSAASTAKALKEHFILERIAEDQQFDASPEDYQSEISLIAAQCGESVRRVRARLEKGGLMDSLRNQIIERKVIDLVLSHAQFKDVPYKLGGADTEAIDQSAGGEDEEESSIPEAKHPGEAEPLRASKERD